MSAKLLMPPLCLALLGLGWFLGSHRSGTSDRDTLEQLRAENARLCEDVARLRKKLDAGGPELGSGLDAQEEAALKAHETEPGDPAEVVALLRRLSPEAAQAFDLDALLGPMLPGRADDVVALVARLSPDAPTMRKLDQRLVRGVIDGTVTQTQVEHWLANTGRHLWDPARPFVESGLRQAPKETRGIFLMTALGMRRGPPEDWIRWAEKTYEYSDPVRVALRNRKKRK